MHTAGSRSCVHGLSYFDRFLFHRSPRGICDVEFVNLVMGIFLDLVK
jgi:hypothetical protein